MEEGGDALEEADREAQWLEQMPLLGHPESDKERMTSWLRLPRRARVAIRRYIAICDMYRGNHSCRCYVLLELHKTISMLQRLRCQGCDNKKPRPQTHKVSPPRRYTFNHEVVVDGFEIVDSVGMRFSISSAVCMETTYDQAWIVRESENLRSFVHGWTRWAGWPNLVRCDRRTHNRGVLGSILAKNGVAIGLARLEAPEQIGRVS